MCYYLEAIRDFFFGWNMCYVIPKGILMGLFFYFLNFQRQWPKVVLCRGSNMPVYTLKCILHTLCWSSYQHYDSLSSTEAYIKTRHKWTCKYMLYYSSLFKYIYFSIEMLLYKHYGVQLIKSFQDIKTSHRISQVIFTSAFALLLRTLSPMYNANRRTIRIL